MIIQNNSVFTKEKATKQILFLHGYLADRRSFACQIPFFSKEFQVFAPDLKGFGNNKGMEYPYSLDDYVNSVKEYMEENSIICPDVIAHSFGGRIAIKMASSNEKVFNKLVLTGCAGLKPAFSVKKFVKKRVFNTLKTFIDKEKLIKFYSSDYLMLDDVMKKSFIKIVNEHLDDRLKFIKNETLIIVGNKDKDTPVYMGRRLNKGIKNSKMTIFSDAGHFAFIDKPNKFNREVREFLLS